MDFLEFDVNGEKFHVHAFIDYKTTAAFGKVVKTRSAAQSAANLLWFLNKTEMHVSGGITLVRLKHDRAREFLANHFKTPVASVHAISECATTLPFTRQTYEHSAVLGSTAWNLAEQLPCVL